MQRSVMKAGRQIEFMRRYLKGVEGAESHVETGKNWIVSEVEVKVWKIDRLSKVLAAVVIRSRV